MRQKLFFEQFESIKKSINSGESISVIGLPGVGITLFLKHLCRESFADFILVDVFSLTKVNKKSFFVELEEKIQKRDTSKKTVIVIPGFDNLKNDFDQEFFQRIKSIKNIDRENIIFIFGICKRIETFFPSDNLDIDFTLFNKKYYLKPFRSYELEQLIDLYGPYSKHNITEIKAKIELSGGHFQILQLLMQESVEESFENKFIDLALKNIYDHLSYTQKKQIGKIATNKPMDSVDKFLLDTGLVIFENKKYNFFSSLFQDFVVKQSVKLPVKERKLLKILQNENGEIVTKERIFDEIWSGDDEYASDWALDALIYRLRNNQAFKSKGYSIENVKKQGYRLVK